MLDPCQSRGQRRKQSSDANVSSRAEQKENSTVVIRTGRGVDVRTTCTALQGIGNMSDRCSNWRSAAGRASIALRASYSTGHVELPQSVTKQAWLLVSRDYLWLSQSHYGATETEQASAQITSNRPHLCKVWHLPRKMSDLCDLLFIMPAVKTTEMIRVKLTKQRGNQGDAQLPL